MTQLAGLRYLDDAELQHFVDLRADDKLLFSRMVSRWEAVARHLPLRSIDFDNHWVDLCEQGPDRCREYVDIFPAKAPQLFLELWKPSNVITAMISSDDSGFTLSGRTSNRSIGVMSVFAGQEGEQASSSSTSKEYCHILASQMGCMWCKVARRRYPISLAMVSLASPIGSGRV